MEEQQISSPKLLTAMAEIKAIMVKHDIAGTCILHEPGHAEYLYNITPSWSCAKITDGGIRVRATVADWGSEERRNKTLEDTCDMLHLLQLVGHQQARAICLASCRLDDALQAQHGTLMHNHEVR